jgi:hypothetical protein
VALTGLPGLAVLGGMGLPSKWKVQTKCGFALLCVLSLVLAWSACGGSGSGGSGSGGSTPTGTYNLTVTGTFTSVSTALTHAAKFTLVVQ